MSSAGRSSSVLYPIAQPGLNSQALAPVDASKQAVLLSDAPAHAALVPPATTTHLSEVESNCASVSPPQSTEQTPGGDSLGVLMHFSRIRNFGLGHPCE